MEKENSRSPMLSHSESTTRGDGLSRSFDAEILNHEAAV
jgi:hypothetical protein